MGIGWNGDIMDVEIKLAPNGDFTSSACKNVLVRLELSSARCILQ